MSRRGDSDGTRNDLEQLEEWQLPRIDSSKMTFLQRIDEGGMARISLYKLDLPGFPGIVATKSLFRGSAPPSFQAGLRREMAILARIKHDNIVKTLGVCETDRGFSLVMEYLKFKSYRRFFGELFERVGRERDASLKHELVPLKIRILNEIVGAMKYLHGIRPKRVLHLDLKTDNVLLDEGLHAKICDFGLSRMTTLTFLRNSSTVEEGGRPGGTRGYIAPEILLNARTEPTTRADVYSFGILEWEILTDKIPYGEMVHVTNVVFNENVIRGLRPDIKDVPVVFQNSFPKLIDMMQRSWASEHSDRPSFDEIHRDLQSIKGRMVGYQLHVKTVVNRTLDLWERHHRPYSTNTSNSACEPLGQRVGCSKHAGYSTSKRTASSMPQTTARQQVATGPWRLSHQENSVQASETQPLIRRSVASTPRSAKKIFGIVCASVLCLAAFAAIFGIMMGNRRSNGGKDCPNLQPPSQETMNCTKATEDTHKKCTFTCPPGYLPRGPNQISCIDGKWSGKLPPCSPSCPGLKPLEFGKFTCDNESFVGSSCNFTCGENFRIQGYSTLVCNQSRQWSHAEPTCACNKCWIGDKCQYSISWRPVEITLDQIAPYVAIKVHYGEEEFTCKADSHLVVPKLEWKGKCIDLKSGYSSSCDGYASRSGSAKHAAAEMIRTLVSQGKYPQPCDPEDMDTGCG